MLVISILLKFYIFNLGFFWEHIYFINAFIIFILVILCTLLNVFANIFTIIFSFQFNSFITSSVILFITPLFLFNTSLHILTIRNIKKLLFLAMTNFVLANLLFVFLYFITLYQLFVDCRRFFLHINILFDIVFTMFEKNMLYYSFLSWVYKISR